MSTELDVNKPGWKTTEILLPILATILGALLAFGIITPEESETITSDVDKAIGSITVLVGWAVYIAGRIKIKIEKIRKG